MLDQVDDFQSDSTTLGWGGWRATTPLPVRVDGGLGGPGDFYLQLSTEGFHLATKNQSQWSGNYLGAGVRGIEMDVRYIDGFDPVALRVAITGPGGFFSSHTATPITDGAWDHYVFGLTPSDLTYVTGGTGDLLDTLSAVEKLLIRHDSAPSPTPPGFHPQHIVATIGIDNIHAMPDPSDIDSDGDVDRADAALLVSNLGIAIGSTPATGDVNSDGATTLADLAILQTNMANALASPAALAAVPEPSGLVLLVVGLIAVGVVRIRRAAAR